MASWHRVCGASDISDGGVIGIECAGSKLMLVREGDSVYAADRTCTHAEADLSEGFVAPGAGSDSAPGVRCPLHFSVFDMATGNALNPPATGSVRTYRARIDGDAVYVEA